MDAVYFTEVELFIIFIVGFVVSYVLGMSITYC